jgi:hypothetical protein
MKYSAELVFSFVFLRIEYARELQVNDSEIRIWRHRREIKISPLNMWSAYTKWLSHTSLVLLYVPLDESQVDYS